MLLPKGAAPGQEPSFGYIRVTNWGLWVYVIFLMLYISKDLKKKHFIFFKKLNFQLLLKVYTIL